MAPVCPESSTVVDGVTVAGLGRNRGATSTTMTITPTTMTAMKILNRMLSAEGNAPFWTRLGDLSISKESEQEHGQSAIIHEVITPVVRKNATTSSHQVRFRRSPGTRSPSCHAWHVGQRSSVRMLPPRTAKCDTPQGPGPGCCWSAITAVRSTLTP